MTKIVRIGLSLMLVLAFAMPAFAGWQSRTLEIEAYKTVHETVSVPNVLVDPNDPVNEQMCVLNTTGEYGCIQYAADYDTTSTTMALERGQSGNYLAPDGTLFVTGQYKDKIRCGNNWVLEPNWHTDYLYRNGQSKNWKFESNHDEYQNVVATYLVTVTNTVCIAWTDDRVTTVDCPANSVTTTSTDVSYSKDVVVTQINLGESITVRGHIWTYSSRAVTFWYVAQWATIPYKAYTVAKSAKVAVPDVDGVFATDSFTFTPKKAGIYRIFLRILKADGTMGEIRTKVVVTDA